MTILNVPVTTNFSAQNLLNIDTINMSGSSILATFSSTQFGAGHISSTVAINNSGSFDRIIINMAAAGTFSAAGWTYLAPVDNSDSIFINGTTGVDTIIGSSGRDNIGTLGGNPAAGLTICLAALIMIRLIPQMG